MTDEQEIPAHGYVPCGQQNQEGMSLEEMAGKVHAATPVGIPPMAKRGRKQKQMLLIETLPENIQEIVDVAIEYKECVVTRTGILKREVELKTKIKDMVKEAGLQPLKDGVIRFRYDGVLISITPRDELIKVKNVPEE